MRKLSYLTNSLKMDPLNQISKERNEKNPEELGIRNAQASQFSDGQCPEIHSIPAISYIESSIQEHNEKIIKEEEEILDAIFSRLTLNSRSVGRKEIFENPKALEALKKERTGLNKRER